MSALSLSAAFSANEMTAPVHDGRVVPEGIDWTVSAVHPSELFWRQLRFGDFDVSEMSLSSLFISISQGRQDWVAIPVFTTRRFFHTGIFVRADAGIDTPSDLAGKRVGVPEYQQTAAVWTRGALQHEFGVTADRMTWFMERPPSLSHGGATRFTPPEGVRLSYIPDDVTLGQVLARGELDAAIHYIAERNLVDRTRDEAREIPDVRPLFPDPVAEGLRYYRKTGLLPVNHCVVVRKKIAEEHPWVTLNVYAAMLQAKELAMGATARAVLPWSLIGQLPADAGRTIEATDPLPYGIKNQTDVLGTLADYLFEQGLAARRVSIEEAFAPSVLDL
jgi:4,5-dihydroxyphthalate decarboxylase